MIFPITSYKIDFNYNFLLLLKFWFCDDGLEGDDNAHID